MREGWITLIVPRGEAWTYPISHGTETYVPWRLDASDPESDWVVTVPPDAAAHFENRGGFRRVPTTVVMIRSSGSIRMYHPVGATSCSWGGASFTPDEDGIFTVPAEAAHDLTCHGFKPAPPKEG